MLSKIYMCVFMNKFDVVPFRLCSSVWGYISGVQSHMTTGTALKHDLLDHR